MAKAKPTPAALRGKPAKFEDATIYRVTVSRVIQLPGSMLMKPGRSYTLAGLLASKVEDAIFSAEKV